MSSNDKSRMHNDTSFRYAVRDLRTAKGQGLSLVSGGATKASNDNAGADPYNTCGGFDRKKHWTGVRKR